MIKFLLMSPAAGGAESSGSGWFNMVFLVGIFAVMYFFMIRPQTKKAKDQKSFIDSIDKGTKIVTVSGVNFHFQSSILIHFCNATMNT